MEKAIRERAHHMWNKAGRPEGDAEAFWLSAQSDVLAASLGQIAAVKAKLAKIKGPVSRKRKAA
jgi:hypothetical protein